MHAKSFIVDGRVGMTGSVNCTDFGMERNDEELTVHGSAAIIAKMTGKFYDLWEDCIPVTREILDRRGEKAAERRERSRSVSVAEGEPEKPKGKRNEKKKSAAETLEDYSLGETRQDLAGDCASNSSGT